MALSPNTSKSTRQIASDLGVSQSHVSKVIAQYKEEGDIGLHYENCGGSNKKVTERDIRHMRDICVKSPKSCASEIKSLMGPSGDHLSVRTMQRRKSLEHHQKTSQE